MLCTVFMMCKFITFWVVTHLSQRVKQLRPSLESTKSKMRELICNHKDILTIVWQREHYSKRKSTLLNGKNHRLANVDGFVWHTCYLLKWPFIILYWRFYSIRTSKHFLHNGNNAWKKSFCAFWPYCVLVL